MDITLSNNQEAKQYEYHIEGNLARIEYIRANNSIYLTHTEVPVGLEGRGIASGMIKAALQEVKNNQWTLVPLCPFVAGYLQKHPEWQDLLQDGFKIT